MNKRLVSLLAVILLISEMSMAQSSYKETPSLKWYNKGVHAFDNEEYGLAKKYFHKSIVDDFNKSTIMVYQLLTNLALNEQKAGSQTENYLELNPFTSQKTILTLALSNYYFNRNQYKKALGFFHKLDVKLLTRSQENNYNYKLAFANFTQKNYTKAKQYLIPISKSGAYQKQANYYLGSIAMERQDYDAALFHFGFVEEDPKYYREIMYQKLVILYSKNDYQKVIELGKIYFPKLKRVSEKSEISKIIGESYFHIHNYKQAVLYLSNYKGKYGRFTGSDHYFLGYAHSQLEEYSAAIKKFNQIIDEKSAISQNAHYHLGHCYLKLNQKAQALNAFKNASEMSFDSEIQKDAFLNYAKLSYDIGNPYKSSSDVLQDFVDAYPDASETNFVESLIVNAYLQFKDYQGAIDYYETQKLLKDEQYQQLLLLRGFELFTEKKHKLALTFFDQTVSMYDDPKIKAKALFWKAETLAELYDFKAATYHYRDFLNSENSKHLTEYADGFYGLAYSLFQQKNYKDAITYFINYLTLANDDAKKRSAVLRIADCHFVNKTYWSALSFYNKIIKENKGQVDYALYQKALSYGFLGKNDQKIKTLQKIQNQFKISAYLDKSYFALGNIFANKGQNTDALAAYDDLIFMYPKSPLVAKAKLKTGIILFNTNNYKGSINVLKRIVADYPGTSEAVQAVNMAEQVYKELGQVDVYAKWATQLEFMNITDADIDNSMYEVAEHKYFNNDLKGAISSFKKYLINFPKGNHALAAHFCLAQAYFNTGAKKRALPEYKKVLEINTNEYTEEALNKLSQLYLENEQWEAASKLLSRIEKETSNTQSKVYAQSNLMKYYFQKENFTQVLHYTDKVIRNRNSKADAVLDAYVYGARGAVIINQDSIAKQYYNQLEIIGDRKVKAEANYYKAFWLHKEKAYEKSNAQVQVLAREFQGYKYWGVRGLLLMAKNFHALKDDFQANFILNNLIKNATEFKEIMQETQRLLLEYKINETNGEVNAYEATTKALKIKKNELISEV
ncbi:MAG: tetratricopeptide repeat protein [Wenyingzhuangia sp.]|jgi:TolA-binding protein|uniref:tetratricopeptide repeat protein n=3 Tax=Wenyingzhuangia sp. TaxID=1964193 RepID=UPI00321B0715